MRRQDRNCVILSEVYLRGRSKYDVKKDVNRGFENYGSGGHALVFMTQGLNTQWVLPVAFFFVSKTCLRTILSFILKEVISSLFNLGLNV